MIELHEVWLKKAETDLKSAKVLLNNKEPLLDTSVYHCQQCVEKTLKGFLSFHKQNILKTHDLSTLVGLCCDIEPELELIRTKAEELNPYSTMYRYPDFQEAPTVKEVKKAVKNASIICKTIKKLLTI